MEVVAKVQLTISEGYFASVRGILRMLDLQNSAVCKIPCFDLNVFLSWFQSRQLLQTDDNQLRLDFANKGWLDTFLFE